MTDNAAPASALGSPVIVAIRNRAPGFEEAFQAALEDEGPDMGAFQAMSVFADWLAGRIALRDNPRAIQLMGPETLGVD